MTSISHTTAVQSPRAQMNAHISAAASAGKISEADENALKSALDNIDSSLASSRGKGGTKGPEGIQERLDSLISAQVSNGTLTEDQASELKSIFAEGVGRTGRGSGMASMQRFDVGSARSLMDSRIASAVSDGTISETDQSAFGAALDNIDSSLAVGGSTASSDPADMKQKMNDLIDQQVSNGTLTTDQASTLKALFAQGPDRQPTDGLSGISDDISVGGIGGRPPMGPPPAHVSKSSDSSSDASSSSSTDTDKLDTLIAFLQQLRQSLVSDTYGANATDESTSGLLLDTAA